MKTLRLIWWACLVTALFGSASRAPAMGEEAAGWVAAVVSIQGDVAAKRGTGGPWQAVRTGAFLLPGDHLHVGPHSRVAIRLVDGAVLRIDQNTTLSFSPAKEKKHPILRLLEGAIHFFSPKIKRIEVATPFVNGVVEGTEFQARVAGEKTRIHLYEGRLYTENRYGSLVMEKGQSLVATALDAPRLETVVRPRDAVQWALYYPPIWDWKEEALSGKGPWKEKEAVRASMGFVERGDIPKAFGALEGILDTAVTDPRFFTHRAGLHLLVGEVDRAEADIRRALDLDPDSAEAFGLLSVMAVTRNEKDKAFELAQKATAADPDSPAAWLSASYARQARFDLAGALRDALKAAAVAPESALSFARVAELELCFGNHEASLAAARKAEQLNPRLSRTWKVLGFARLSRIEIGEALAAFEKATVLDPAAPMPRLGLGLAKIRNGYLQEGRAEMEIAVCLDPDNALLRSYLGKAYFEEKRDGPDGAQLAAAKALDPLDPTPWFYDAIRKQSLNRPVEALLDLERSISLNDNRAVYRSRLLLDEDLAARSAGLGRIYADLGFQQLALVKGWKSVNTDPANHSAHRFLADVYAVLPRHEVARVSELLQSQLLQPIGILPVQPEISESALYFPRGFGADRAAMNEFGPLFERNRFSVLTGGLFGENGIRGGEWVLSGLQGGTSFSFGQAHDETDGFRVNNDLSRDIYNAFVQTRLSPGTSVFAQGRLVETDAGDLPLRFSFDGETPFSENRRNERAEASFRAGVRHAVAPDSLWIGHVTHLEADETASDVFGPLPIRIDLDETADMAEVQHLYRKGHLSLTSGAGYFRRDARRTIAFFDETLERPDAAHANLYLYALVPFPEKVVWTLGASGDFYDDDETRDRDRVNPKLGVTFTPFVGTTLRGAAFRALKRSLVSRQTIEPTQVAGFNQFFDDPNGTEYWRYGLALDQVIVKNLYGGIEYTTRRMDTPVTDIETGESQDHEWKEDVTRVYLHWAPHPRWSLNAAYLYERFDRDDRWTGEEHVKELRTHRFPLGFNVFFPRGLSARLQMTHVRQEGVFGTEPADFRPGEDDFQVVDADLRYRLPGRAGYVTLGVRNLLDTSFRFQDMDVLNPVIFPERTLMGRITLVF